MRRLQAALAALLLLLPLSAGADTPEPLAPPDTSSPRATLVSFVETARLAWRIFMTEGTPVRSRYEQAGRMMRRASRCLDLGAVPPAALRQTSVETSVLLLEVLDRVALPPAEQIPDAARIEAEGVQSWGVPGTEIEIARVQEGPREGEFLFTAETVARARDFYESSRLLPYQPGNVVQNAYDVYRTLPGWMIPLAWIEALPGSAKAIVLGQAVWQWIGLALMLVLGFGVIAMARRWSRAASPDPSVRSHLRRLVFPGAIVLAAMGARMAAGSQLGFTGDARLTFEIALRAAGFLAAAWSVMIVGSVIAESIVSSPRIHPQSVDAHLIRVAGRVFSFIIAVLVLAEGAQMVGIPVVGVVAGLGVGGLAVALAAQSTIENFIGSLTIFADRPVRVGDFCRFGDEVGTVEQIGLRSTRIRTLGRSVVTVPNAEFSKMKLDNYSARDQNLLRTTLRLRYETSAEQLRSVLEGLRRMLVEHPRILDDPARVRLVELGSYSLDLEVFAYADARDWNDFLAVREDVFLRMIAIVEQAGASFAIPAQTSYLASDEGVDAERQRAAELQLEAWRRQTDQPAPPAAATAEAPRKA